MDEIHHPISIRFCTQQCGVVMNRCRIFGAVYSATRTQNAEVYSGSLSSDSTKQTYRVFLRQPVARLEKKMLRWRCNMPCILPNPERTRVRSRSSTRAIKTPLTLPVSQASKNAFAESILTGICIPLKITYGCMKIAGFEAVQACDSPHGSVLSRRRNWRVPRAHMHTIPCIAHQSLPLTLVATNLSILPWAAPFCRSDSR